jgi:hypothetical protein
MMTMKSNCKLIMNLGGIQGNPENHIRKVMERLAMKAFYPLQLSKLLPAAANC